MQHQLIESLVENQVQCLTAVLVTNIRYEYVKALPDKLSSKQKAKLVRALDTSIGVVLSLKPEQVLFEYP